MMELAIGIGPCVSPARGFSPIALYGATGMGAWYDLSATGRTWSDVAGSIPTTATGQSVARLDDLTGQGRHALQPTVAARPICAIVPATGVRNLLTHTEDITDASWAGYFDKPTLTGGQVAPDGSETAFKWSVGSTTGSGSGDVGGLFRSTGADNGETYTVSVWLKASTGSQSVGLGLTGGDLDAVTLTTSWTRYSVTKVSTGDDLFALRESLSGSTEIFFWHPQVELGSTATAYQRVNSVYEVIEKGVAARPHVVFDQIDDSLVATLPNLGSDATEAWAHEGGVTINGGLSIGAGSRTLPTPIRLFAYVVIDRPLTDAETTALTAWLDARRSQ